MDKNNRAKVLETYNRYLNAIIAADMDAINECIEYPLAYINHRINAVLENVKKRVKEKKLKIDVDVQYLRSIFLNDFICPILETKMVWGGDNSDNSPSLDRVVSDKRYVKGYRRWIFDIANTLKSDRNFEIIEKIYLDMKKQREERN